LQLADFELDASALNPPIGQGIDHDPCAVGCFAISGFGKGCRSRSFAVLFAQFQHVHVVGHEAGVVRRDAGTEQRWSAGTEDDRPLQDLTGLTESPLGIPQRPCPQPASAYRHLGERLPLCILHLLGSGERPDELNTRVMREFPAVTFGTPVDGQVTQMPASGRHMLVELAHGNIVDLPTDAVDLPTDPVDLTADAVEPRILARRVTHQCVDDLLRGIGPRFTCHGGTLDELAHDGFRATATRATASSLIITALPRPVARACCYQRTRAATRKEESNLPELRLLHGPAELRPPGRDSRSARVGGGRVRLRWLLFPCLRTRRGPVVGAGPATARSVGCLGASLVRLCCGFAALSGCTGLALCGHSCAVHPITRLQVGSMEHKHRPAQTRTGPHKGAAICLTCRYLRG
jgi:hypothetical protein